MILGLGEQTIQTSPSLTNINDRDNGILAYDDNYSYQDAKNDFLMMYRHLPSLWKSWHGAKAFNESFRKNYLP